jgi:predicted nucleic acid-binding protein
LDDALLLLRAFRMDCSESHEASWRFTVISVTEEILRRAAALAGEHGLRAYDSVQLASALMVREVSRDCDTFAAFDRALVRAARSEGMKVL